MYWLLRVVSSIQWRIVVLQLTEESIIWFHVALATRNMPCHPDRMGWVELIGVTRVWDESLR